MRGVVTAVLLACGCTQPATILDVADPAAKSRMVSGFYAQEGDHRWTAGQFQALLNQPKRQQGKSVRLVIQAFVPDALLEAKHDTQISCAVDGVALDPERYDSPGPKEYVRDTPPLSQDPVHLSCTLSNPLPPGPKDSRELGIVVSKIRLIGR